MIKDRLARPSTWVTSFLLPHDSLGVGERGFGQVVTQLHQLTRPITPAYDRYVQYLLTGPTHQSLTDTGGGYSLEGVGFHTPLPDLLNRQSSPFHLRAPSDLQFSHNLTTKT
jgi:hypothetical protein